MVTNQAVKSMEAPLWTLAPRVTGGILFISCVQLKEQWQAKDGLRKERA
jgi:hypothetical protein